jgi:hypothetical protein
LAFGDPYLTRRVDFDELPQAVWGCDAVVIDVAGGPYRFSGLAPRQADWVRGRFQSLCRAPGAEETAVVASSVHPLPEDAFREIDTRGWEYTFDRDYHPERLRLAGLDFVAEVCFTPGLEGRLWTSRTDPDGFPGVFENYFRVLVAYRISLAGGVLLHSAAFVRRGRAQVVFGRSGAGKSTSARLALAAGWEVLSDDLNALLPDAGGWRVERLPFAGELTQAPRRGDSYPLAGLLWLHQSANHALRPASAAIMLARLLACTPIVNADPHRLGDVLANLGALVARTRTATLDFAPDPRFLALIEPQEA